MYTYTERERAAEARDGLTLVLIIGNLKSNHLAAQGTFSPRPPLIPALPDLCRPRVKGALQLLSNRSE